MYRSIGAGTCGRVFEQSGSISALKVANTADDTGLWNDYKMHTRVVDGFANTKGLHDIRVPKVFYYVLSSDEAWWGAHKDKFPAHYGEASRSVLCTERILPLPERIRHELIDVFCPMSIKEAARAAPANKDCLARIYLGKRPAKRTTPLTVFSLRNFNLDLDRIEQAKIQGMENIATAMGSALAVMHWRVGIDADDVEFVLGSSPTYPVPRPLSPQELSAISQPTSTWQQTMNLVNFKRRVTQLWLLDFNRCHDISRDEKGVSQAVSAFFRNDAYYPRPLGNNPAEKELWEAFSDGYIQKSNEIMGSDDDQSARRLPGHFLEECIAEQGRRMVAKAEAEKRLEESEQ
jgi:hypothetical protein